MDINIETKPEELAKALGAVVSEGTAIWGINKFLAEYARCGNEHRLLNLGFIQKTLRNARRQIRRDIARRKKRQAAAE